MIWFAAFGAASYVEAPESDPCDCNVAWAVVGSAASHAVEPSTDHDVVIVGAGQAKYGRHFQNSSRAPILMIEEGAKRMRFSRGGALVALCAFLLIIRHLGRKHCA